MALFRRLVERWTANVVWPLCVFAILITSATSSLPKTTIGTHCPTAPVQSVTETNNFGQVVTRAPKLGEEGFKQCSCKEQKAEQTESARVQVHQIELPPALCLGHRIDLRLPVFAKPIIFNKQSLLRASLWNSVPPVPPPNVI